jgi:phosphate transport system substrate-binding protein
MTGAGATFPYPIYRQVGRSLQGRHRQRPELPVGRLGRGIKQIKAKTVDFGASDMPLKAKPSTSARKNWTPKA